jgi:hypothetical protein
VADDPDHKRGSCPRPVEAGPYEPRRIRGADRRVRARWFASPSILRMDERPMNAAGRLVVVLLAVTVTSCGNDSGTDATNETVAADRSTSPGTSGGDWRTFRGPHGVS